MTSSLSDRHEPDYRMQQELEEERREILERIIRKAEVSMYANMSLVFTKDEIAEMRREFGL